MTLDRPGRSAFTLIELLIVVAVISLLLSIVLPVLWVARSMGDSVTCVNNMRQVALAANNYANSNNGCLPGGANDIVDGKNYAWLRILGGPDLIDQRIGGTMAEYLEESKVSFICPTLKADEDVAGQNVICHYAMPTLLAGMPAGMATEAFYYDPIGSNTEATKKRLPGVPLVVEPLVVRLEDDTVKNYLGAFNEDTRLWTTLPDGAFEGSDEIATTRHLGACNMAFADGHASAVRLPEGIKASDLYILIRGEAGSKTLHMGNTNGFNSWLSRSE